LLKIAILVSKHIAMETETNYSNFSDSEKNLQIIENRKKYLPETVESAIIELQHSGRIFSDEEVQKINADIKKQRDNAAVGGNGSSGIFNNNYKYNLVEDPQAPLLYSKRAIYIFTVLCGALFGSIMLSINSSKVKNRTGILLSLLFGVAFTMLQVVGSDYVKVGNSYAIVCGLIAAICIDRFFWKRFIDDATTFYRPKSIWVPLLIAVVLGGLILWATFYSSGL